VWLLVTGIAQAEIAFALNVDLYIMIMQTFVVSLATASL
jgi:hypothetical protein